MNIENVKSCIQTRRHEPARLMLDELRQLRPDYPLSGLCAVFLKYNRPECARKLDEVVREDGDSLVLSDRLLKMMYPEDTLAEENDDSSAIENPTPSYSKFLVTELINDVIYKFNNQFVS